MSAQSPVQTRPGPLGRFWGWLPDRVDRRVIVAAWAAEPMKKVARAMVWSRVVRMRKVLNPER